MGYPSRNYRVGTYRRRGWQNTVIIVLSIIVLLFTAFFIIGNRLNSKDDDNTAETKPSTADTQKTSVQSLHPDYFVNGYAISIEGITQSEFSNAVRAVSLEGVNTISVNFTTRDGKPVYSSGVAQALGYQSEPSGLISASSVSSSANASGFFVSGYITVNSHKESDGKISSVRRSYEAAIACELIEKGVRDVIVRCDKLGTEDIDALESLGKDIRDINREARVGIALSKEILSSENSAVYVDKLKNVYSFICLDLSTTDDNDISKYVESSVSSNLLYILRDDIRILLPVTDDETLEELIKILAANNVSNWQVVYK